MAALPLPKEPRTTLNVGVISGGTSVNTIAQEASCKVDLRSENPKALQALAQQIETLVQESNRPGVRLVAEVVGQRPAGEIPRDHPLVALASFTLQDLGIEPQLSIGSTDANVPLSRGIPALTIGLTHGQGAHTLGEFIYIRPLKKGLQQLIKLVRGIYDHLA
jgi:di/tripeptidase